eukprot:7902967-Alexandrium_andersonii.AAC.1
MSASLVGSEMCIRDRCSSTAAGASSPSATAAVARASIALARPIGTSSACLLYTSDAADDM